jgi:hypothetical protein
MKKISITIIMASSLLLAALPINAKKKKHTNMKEQTNNIINVHFDQLFTKNSDGSISPKVPLIIRGVGINPGVRFTKGVSFAGVDISTLEGKILQVDTSNGTNKLK